MMRRMKFGQRLISAMASIALIVGTVSFNVSAAVDGAAQSGSSDYIGFDIRPYGFNVYGKSSSADYMKTTYSNGGYTTFLTVDGSTVYTSSSTPNTPSSISSAIFEYGKDFSVADASVNVTASINSSGKGVLLTYTVTNDADTERTMSVGSCSDCEIYYDDDADVRVYENGLSMTDMINNNIFYLLPVSNEFSTLWSGDYYDRYDNLTTNSESHDYDGDSGLGWSWTVTVPAHGTVTRTAIIACGEVEILRSYTLSFDANGGEGTMASHSFVSGIESTLPANTFTREGYDFLGWSTNASATAADYADQGSIAISEDTTLYAVWARQMSDPSFTAPTPNTLTYNGSAQALVTAGSAQGGTMVYSLSENGPFETSIPTGIEAGDYTVYYKVLGDESHFDTNVASVVATILPAPTTTPTATPTATPTVAPTTAPTAAPTATPAAQVLGAERAEETTSATATPTPTTAPSNTVATGEASGSAYAVTGILLIVAGTVVASFFVIRKREEAA